MFVKKLLNEAVVFKFVRRAMIGPVYDFSDPSHYINAIVDSHRTNTYHDAYLSPFPTLPTPISSMGSHTTCLSS